MAAMHSASTTKTALILIDVQNWFRQPPAAGVSRSTPDCEKNIEKLLQAARNYNSNNAQTAAERSHAVAIHHVYHHSLEPESLLRPGKEMKAEDGQTTIKAIDPQPFAAPVAGESVWWKNVNSAFIGTGLEAALRAAGVRQLVICGLTTDHCVSTSTRMASNLRIVDVVARSGEGDGVEGTVVEELGTIALAGDACATWSKGSFDGETVHRVNLASLDGEFATVRPTAGIVEKIFAV